jgi:predicted TIM-barrel fold metal-dependent hydrolase
VTNQHIALSNVDWGNDDLRRDVKNQPRLRGVYGTWVVRDRDDIAPAEAIDALIANDNAAGVQFWPAATLTEFAPWQCPKLFEAMADRRLPVFMHSDQTNWNAVYAVLTAYPTLPLVLQRVSYGDVRKALAMMRQCPNLYLCTSPPFVGGSVLEQFDRYVGAERLLFGSGYPKFDILPAVAQVAYTELSNEKKALIAGGNLNRLLEAVQ